MDSAVKVLAGDMHKTLIGKRAQKITVGQFIYRSSITPLGTYWINQLTEELANIPNRPYIILGGGSAGSDWTISGEIVEVADIIRIYTRLMRSEDRAVETASHSDFARNEVITRMLLSEGSHSSSVAMDEWEIDSFDNPVPYEIGADENAVVMNRTLHDGDDEDFFLLVPDRNGRLVIETTGNIDTYMELFDANSRESLEENDDGGSRYNARIRYTVQAGKRYIVKVTGYDGEKGQYGFRAYFSTQALPDEDENDYDSTT